MNQASGRSEQWSVVRNRSKTQSLRLPVLTRFIFPLGVAFELGGVKIDLAEIAGRITLGLVVEVFGRGVAAFASGGYCFGSDGFAKLDHRDKAIATDAIDLFGAFIGIYAEGGKRTPQGGRESDWDTRPGVGERVNGWTMSSVMR